jgi:hypothetical protein
MFFFPIRFKGMDKEWTKLHRLNLEYRKGVESFLDFAFSKGKPQGHTILCSCAKCRNPYWKRKKVVRNHLIGPGFLQGYDVWIYHGEQISLAHMEIDEGMQDKED